MVTAAWDPGQGAARLRGGWGLIFAFPPGNLRPREKHPHGCSLLQAVGMGRGHRATGAQPALCPQPPTGEEAATPGFQGCRGVGRLVCSPVLHNWVVQRTEASGLGNESGQACLGTPG